MNSRRSRNAVAAIVAVALLATPVVGEVSAELDESGEYLGMLIRANSSTKNLRVWTVPKEKEHFYPLNRGGDGNGDLWPLVAESPLEGSRPWVVWSRFTGTGFDLAWARWVDDASGWSSIAWVSQPEVRDQLDPAIDFDTDGRPFLVWWEEDTTGASQVYLSLFLDTVWSAPYLVSPDGVDASFPTVTVIDDNTVEVTYDTPEGPQSRTVKFQRPATITDDVAPVEHFTLLGVFAS